jgi:hypothetical protein
VSETATRRWRAAAFVVASAATALLFFVPKYLPMGDLPEHLAQVTMWRGIDANDPLYSSRFALHLFTPYLLPLVLLRVLGAALPLWLAAKLLLLAVAIATPLATTKLLRAVGGEPAAALLVFPTLFAQPFYWGLLNHLLAVPLALLLVAEAYAPPTRKQAARLLALGALSWLCHVVVLALACLAAALAMAAQSSSLRGFLRRAWPLAAPWPLAIAWLLLQQRDQAMAHEPIRWSHGWERLTGLLPNALGLAGSFDPVRVVAAVALALLVLGPASRTVGWRARVLPLVAVLAFYVAAPWQALGATVIPERAASLVAPFALLALAPVWPRRIALRSALLAACVCFSLGALGRRFVAFDADARDWDAVAAQMQPGRTALAMIYRADDPRFAARPFEHFVTWYVSQGHGVVEPCAANRYQLPVRFREGTRPLPPDWLPTQLDWSRDGGFDYYVVRAPSHSPAQVFHAAAPSVTLLAHQGLWWLYGRR